MKRRGVFFKRLLKALFVLAVLAIMLAVYMRYIEPSMLDITYISIESSSVDGSFKIVAFGDTHVGNGKTVEDLFELCSKINSLSPDCVVFLGDLFDDYSAYEEDPSQVSKALAEITAVYKLAVRGNHDVGGGAEWVYPDIVNAGGFILLENENIVLENGINIVGSAEMLYHSPNVSGFVSEGFDVLLAHEPDVACMADGYELQLSGHSHGGQVYIPISFVMDRILPQGSRVYVRGMYEKDDGGMVYVNRGFGMSLAPIRLFSVPELTVITINGGE